jgi:tetratricopeptide (TPR) repeat protein
MRSALILALLASLPTPARAQESQPEAERQNIIVTGTRIQDFRDRLRDCLARNCPPNEDIDATMALAEVLFVEGDYHGARRVIRRSIGRNRDEARNYPEPVSDLYRANARVARNLGLDRDARFSTVAILRVLRTGIPVEDHRHFTARFEIAQALIAFGRYRQALNMLEELAERARAVGRDDIVAMAELRRLWIQRLLTPRGSPPSRALLALAHSPDPRRSVGAKMLLIRIHGENGDTADAERLIAELGRSSGRRPLLFNPPYEMLQRENVEGQAHRAEAIYAGDSGTGQPLYVSNLGDRLVENFADKWIDVGFWIQPDGRVEGLEIVRSRNDTSWSEPLLQSIRGRRYATSEGTSTYRLERYTYTSGYNDTGANSRIARRSARARVEYFDLSETASPPPEPARPPS